jgi:hypothetical protein
VQPEVGRSLDARLGHQRAGEAGPGPQPQLAARTRQPPVKQAPAGGGDETGGVLQLGAHSHLAVVAGEQRLEPAGNVVVLERVAGLQHRPERRLADQARADQQRPGQRAAPTLVGRTVAGLVPLHSDHRQALLERQPAQMDPGRQRPIERPPDVW